MTLPGRLQTLGERSKVDAVSARYARIGIEAGPRIANARIRMTTMKHWLALAAAAATWSCSSDSAKTGSTPDTAKPAAAMATASGVDLTGAGATFPQPLYSSGSPNTPRRPA